MSRRAALLAVITVGLGEAAVGYGTLIAHAFLETDVPVYDYWLESSVSFPVILLLAMLLVARRPEHLVTRLLVGSALASGLQFSGGSLAHWLAATGRPPAVVPLSLVASLAQISSIFLLLTMILFFPTGRLLSSRWRPVMVAFVLGTLTSAGATLWSDRLLAVGPEVANPLAGSPPEWLPLLGALGVGGAGVMGGVVSVGERYCRAHGVERQQLRWFFTSLVAGLLAILLISHGSLGWMIGPTLVTVGMAVAILRTRLRDEVDLGALTGDLRAVVAETMMPAPAGVWVRGVRP